LGKNPLVKWIKTPNEYMELANDLMVLGLLINKIAEEEPDE